MKKSLDIQTNLDSKDVIGSIRLDMASPVNREKVWIVVEGINDLKLFKKLINGHHISIEISGGKAELTKTVNEFSSEPGRVIGIRDADFLHLDNKTDLK